MLANQPSADKQILARTGVSPRESLEWGWISLHPHHTDRRIELENQALSSLVHAGPDLAFPSGMTEPFPVALPSQDPSPFVEDERRLIDRLIEQQLVDVSYQPIVDLRSRSIFAYEALARPRDGYFRTPGDLIEAAVRAQCMGKLGRHLRALSISGCSRWPLFLNLHPHEFGDCYLVRPDDPIFTHSNPVYLEISEAVPTEFADQCHSVLAELRKKGVLLAIDDFGAGSSSLKYIVELEPDIVKLDRELIMGCLPDSREFELLRSLTQLCHRMKATVIAEGVETLEELKATMAAGIDYAQGFLLSVPQSTPSSFFWPPELPPDSTVLLTEFGNENESDVDEKTSQAESKADQANSAAKAEVASARITIRRLEEELAEAKKDLTDSLEERALLAERLRRVSHPTSTPARGRQRPSPPSSPATVVAPPPKVSATDSTAPNQEDALDFLRQIEAERDQNAGNTT